MGLGLLITGVPHSEIGIPEVSGALHRNTGISEAKEKLARIKNSPVA
jgi:hypothetical protein